MGNPHTCTHIKAAGIRCGSPALRGEQFCYFHQRMHRGVRTPPQARLHPIANFEDGESIQLALMEVTNALMRNTIDLKRATLILRALHIAVKNAGRVKFDLFHSSMVKEIPAYAAPHNDIGTAAPGCPAGDPEAGVEDAYQIPGYLPHEAIIQARAEQRAYEAAERARAERAKTSVSREPSPAVPQPEASLPSHDFKKPPAPEERLPHPRPARSAAEGRHSKAENSEPPRKPPTNVKKVNGATTASAPKERKIAAHGASRG